MKRVRSAGQTGAPPRTGCARTAQQVMHNADLTGNSGMATLVDICNMALAEIAAGPISSIGDTSIEAREVSRFATPLLTEVALWSDWSWAVARSTLTATTNDRAAEWTRAYSVPSNCARPLAIRQAESDAKFLPRGGPFPFPVQDAVPLAFLHEGGVIYSNVWDATLVFVATVTDVTTLPALVTRAFVLELAARVAVPIRKDTELARAVAQAAELARARAIAEDFNQRVRRPARYVSDAAFARAGIGSEL